MIIGSLDAERTASNDSTTLHCLSTNGLSEEDYGSLKAACVIIGNRFNDTNADNLFFRMVGFLRRKGCTVASFRVLLFDAYCFTKDRGKGMGYLLKVLEHMLFPKVE